MKSWIMPTAVLVLVSCGTEPTGPSAVQGIWRFDASYAGSNSACTIAGAQLYLLQANWVWAGTLTGGQIQCDGIPGEVVVPVSPMSIGIDHISVEGDSVAFTLSGSGFFVHGRTAEDSMSGQIDVTSPTCGCTELKQTGTWTATRQ